VPGPGSLAGLRLSNIGGYASWQDVFEGEETSGSGAESSGGSGVESSGGSGVESSGSGGVQSSGGRDVDGRMSEPSSRMSEAEREGRRQARRLHAIVSMAVDVASRDDLTADDAARDEHAAVRPSLPSRQGTDGDTTERHCRADGGVDGGADGESGRLHAVTAWLNVNRCTDHNEMHVHPAELWSAVYYVSRGEADDEASGELGGHMVFRAGVANGDARRADGRAGHHRYFTVAPVPGSLWLLRVSREVPTRALCLRRDRMLRRRICSRSPWHAPDEK
jgi:hypothetical protein